MCVCLERNVSDFSLWIFYIYSYLHYRISSLTRVCVHNFISAWNAWTVCIWYLSLTFIIVELQCVYQPNYCNAFNCATMHEGSWWYRRCLLACLTWPTIDAGVQLWQPINSRMMIRPLWPWKPFVWEAENTGTFRIYDVVCVFVCVFASCVWFVWCFLFSMKKTLSYLDYPISPVAWARVCMCTTSLLWETLHQFAFDSCR